MERGAFVDGVLYVSLRGCDGIHEVSLAMLRAMITSSETSMDVEYDPNEVQKRIWNGLRNKHVLIVCDNAGKEHVSTKMN